MEVASRLRSQLKIGVHGLARRIDGEKVNISPQIKMSQSMDREGWGFFGAIFCISLSSRADRRERAKLEFARVGLGDRVQFFIVERDPENSERGIFDSHVRAISRGIQQGADPILIFEDDIVFDRFSERKLADAIAFMKNDANWHAVFFGCFAKSSTKTNHRSIVRIRYRTTMHAYALKRGFAETLIRQPWTRGPLDDALRDMNDPEVYAVYPAFAFQSNSPTDNDRQIGIDRIRRMLGGMARLQKWNEFSCRHWTSLVIVHVVAVILLIVAFLLHL